MSRHARTAAHSRPLDRCQAPWIAAGVAMAVLAPATWAQSPLGGHGMPAAPRALHERLALADAAGLIVVDSVERGRIHVRDGVALVGTLEPDFAIKRSPSRPPGVEPGEEVMAFLRGARSPYLLVDDARELVRVRSDAERARWQLALPSVRNALEDPDALRGLYAQWLDGRDETLREEAVRGLFSDRLRPLPNEFVDARVAVALDPSARPERRSVSAFIATMGARGTDALLAKVPNGEAPSSEVVAVALGAGVRMRLPATTGAFLRSLLDADPDVRLAALRFARTLLREPGTREAVATVAEHDPHDGVREAASQALRQEPRGRKLGSDAGA